MKFNESTPQRPEGDRVIDAPVVSIDIQDYIRLLKSESTWQESDRNAITVYKTNGLQHVLVAMHKGSVMPENVVEDLISVQVLEGEIGFETEERTIVLPVGHIVNIYSGIKHSVHALTDAVFLLSLSGKSE